MYQLEVKRFLVQHRFPLSEGWNVTAHIDGMERARGGTHSDGKRKVAQAAENWLRAAGVNIGVHSIYGPADIVATRASSPTFIVEVEGDSARGREQSMYSAIGQTLLQMTDQTDRRFAVAVPDSPKWEAQLRKVPERILKLLSLDLWLVSDSGVRVP